MYFCVCYFMCLNVLVWSNLVASSHVNVDIENCIYPVAMVTIMLLIWL